MGNSSGDRDRNTIDAEFGVPGRRWADELLRDFPELQELERQTIESVGEPVPVLLLGDAIRWLVQSWKAGDHARVRDFMARMDSDYPGLEPVLRTIVDVVFVAGLPGPGESGDEIAAFVGPAIRPEYDRTHRGMGFEPWITTLALDLPQMQSLLTEHIDTFGEVLSTILFADVTRWLVSRCAAGDIGSAKTIVDRINSDYGNLNSAARNAVNITLLEDLPRLGSVGSELADWLEPTLQMSREGA